VAGGVLVKTADGEIIGAVGVSGDTSDNDEVVGCKGIEAAGFVADGG
ncbi:MAG: GlcG protein, partial [Hyphomicrobiales bacterium]|nr:GlcG protein [Hyphomicrobiales bacterium]